MQNAEQAEALKAVGIYFVSQIATGYCLYQHVPLAAIIAWVIGQAYVFSYVNQNAGPRPPEPPEEPKPPNTFWGGPHGRY